MGWAAFFIATNVFILFLINKRRSMNRRRSALDEVDRWSLSESKKKVISYQKLCSPYSVSETFLLMLYAGHTVVPV